MHESKSSAKSQPAALLDEEAETHSYLEESASSDQGFDPEVSLHPIHPQALPQFPPTSYMPYIEGPCMEWTVNDGLYLNFFKIEAQL